MAIRRSGSAPEGLFRSNELRRLISAILFLGVLGLFYNHFRQTKLVDDAARESEAASGTAPAPTVSSQSSPAVAWQETVVPIPDSEGAADPLEQDAFKEEAEAIVDKKPYAAEEMASYWRLFRWAGAETTAQLEQRARRDVYFTHLYQDPAKFRGQLIHLRLHVKRVIPQPDLAENSAHVDHVYEATGLTDDSRTFPYFVIFSEKPPQLPVGPNVHEEASFVGFFHKLVTYEELTGTTRAAPVLIGRITWIENPLKKGLREQSESTNWIFLLVFGLLAIVLGGQWWFASRRKVITPEKPADEQALNRWLESGEIPDAPGPASWMPPDDSDSPPKPPT